MKKVLLCAALLGANTYAALISCTPVPANANIVDAGSGASVTFTCNPAAGLGAGQGDDNLALDGFNVNAIRIVVTATAQYSGPLTGTFFSFNGTASGGPGAPAGTVSNAPVAISFTTDGNGDGANAGTTISANGFIATGGVDVIPSFTVTVTGSGLNQSGQAPWNSTASVRYEVQATSNSAVPEPSSLALLGSALVGLGVFARRKR